MATAKKKTASKKKTAPKTPANKTATKTAKKTAKKTVAKPTRRRPRPTATKRLERGEGDNDKHVFWEISQFGTAIKIRHGRWLSEGRTSEKEFDDKAAAAEFFEKAIEEKRAEGFSEPAPKEVIGGSSRKGVSARNPELEALIEEDPADLSRYLIYADWLQQQGDPRGELILAQHALATAPEKDLEAADNIEYRLLRDFRRELLGPLAQRTLIRHGTTSVRALGWRCGFVRAMRWQSNSPIETFIEALQHPTLRFLELLVADGHHSMGTCAALRQHAPKTFRTLSIRTGWSGTAHLDVIASEYPQVRSLWVAGGLSPWDLKRTPNVVFENLEELDLGFFTSEAIAMTANAKFPKVERVHLTLAGFERDVPRPTLLAEMQTLLRTFPAARHMTLRRWQIGEDQDPLADAILSALKEVPTQLTQLNLHLSLSREPPNLFNALGALPKTLRINIPIGAIQNAYLRSEITNKIGTHITFTQGDPIERNREDIAQFHHQRLGDAAIRS